MQFANISSIPGLSATFLASHFHIVRNRYRTSIVLHIHRKDLLHSCYHPNTFASLLIGLIHPNEPNERKRAPVLQLADFLRTHASEPVDGRLRELRGAFILTGSNNYIALWEYIGLYQCIKAVRRFVCVEYYCKFNAEA